MHDQSRPIFAQRPEVTAFARHMERKLREHDDRPGWKGDDPVALLRRLREEVDELDAALFNGERKTIVDEAADVGNFAMMIADVEGGLPPDGGKSDPAVPRNTDEARALVTEVLLGRAQLPTSVDVLPGAVPNLLLLQWPDGGPAFVLNVQRTELRARVVEWRGKTPVIEWDVVEEQVTP